MNSVDRVLVAGSRNGYSWSYSDPVNQTGKIQEISATFDPANLFVWTITSPASLSCNAG
ncbi:MAG: hypothetical protein SF187_30270 [Deltaproteobacteria bacterium]|nr:hypothetical protein [Deltaproteobacteria bacterium]